MRLAGRDRDPAHARRSACGRRVASWTGCASSAATSGFADTLLQAIGELESGLVELDGLGGDLAALVGAYREELGRLGRPGPRRPAPACRRAAARRPRRMERSAGLRLRVRGPHRRRVGAPRGARRANRRDAVRSRTSPGERRSRRSSGRSRISRTLAGRQHRGAAARHPARRCRRRSSSSSASCSPTTSRQARRSTAHSLPRGGGHARHRRAPRERGRGAPARRHGAGARRGRLRVRRSLAGAARGGVRAAWECRTPSSTAASGRHRLWAARSSRSCGTRGSAAAAATSSPSSVRRSRGSSVARSTSSKGGLRGRAVAEPARVEEEGERLRGAPVPALVELRADGRSRSRARASSSRSMVRNAWGLESPPTSDDARDRRARVPSRGADARRARCARRRASPESSREDVLAALERTRVAPESPAQGSRRRARPRTSPDPHVRRRVRARARGGRVSAPRAPVAAPRRRAASRARRTARATGRRRARPLPLLHDLHARDAGGSCSSVRRRATRVCRASRARSGRTSGRCSTPPTFSAPRGADRSRL